MNPHPKADSIMMTLKRTRLVMASAAVLLASCASAPSPAELDRLADQMIKSSFRAEGQAQLDRLNQDLAQQACSALTPPSPEVVKQIETQALSSIKWPTGGQYLGDWKEGEKLAQNGRGKTWTDPADAPSGGNCYNCHQLSKQEISFGTIGPSLYNYGKTRGVKDPADPAAAPVLQYTWGKIYNSKAYNACSGMPRMGHAGVLTEAQMRDVMALLLDPKSPVNQ
jgi:sulfur-oxidizing protein SoxX